MRVFLGWSGIRSHKAAKALHEWLPHLNHHVQPWLSTEDIGKGVKWRQDLASNLKTVDFGIICLTPEALSSNWVYFEVGALSQERGGDRVCPLLLGLDGPLPEGPLAGFQSAEPTREDVRRTLSSINDAISTADRLTQTQLEKAFEAHWPGLEKSLSEALDDGETVGVAQAAPRDLLVEVLETVRRLERDQSELPGGAPALRRGLQQLASEAHQNVDRYKQYLFETEASIANDSRSVATMKNQLAGLDEADQERRNYLLTTIPHVERGILSTQNSNLREERLALSIWQGIEGRLRLLLES